MKSFPLTRQGVRDLDVIEPSPRRQPKNLLVSCSACDGAGSVEFDDLSRRRPRREKCPYCNGAKKVWIVDNRSRSDA